MGLADVKPVGMIARKKEETEEALKAIEGNRRPPKDEDDVDRPGSDAYIRRRDREGEADFRRRDREAEDSLPEESAEVAVAGLEAVESYVKQQEAADERKRREAQALLSADVERQKNDLLGLKATEAESPARLLELKNVYLDPTTRKNAEEHKFLDEQGRRREDRQTARLSEREEQLKIPSKSALERYNEVAAPAGRFANEDPTLAAAEVRADPAGRQADLDAVINQIRGGTVSRETPTYTDAPQNIMRGPNDDEMVPYTGAMKGLQGVMVKRSSIRPEFGGTAPDTILSFSDRPLPGMRRYNAPPESDDQTPIPEDVGAPGGGFVAGVDRGGNASPQAALLESLIARRSQAANARLTPQELAADLVAQQPEWDKQAAASDPSAVEQSINAAVAERRLRPETANTLRQRYGGFADSSFDQDGVFNPEKWTNFLTTSRQPAPGEAAARLQAPSPVPVAAAQEQQATQAALQPPPGGPGATQSPSLAAESQGVAPSRGGSPEALLAELQGPPTPEPSFMDVASRGGPQVQGEAGADFSSQGLRRGVGEAARFGLPLLGQTVGAVGAGILGRSPGAMNFGRATGGALGGALGTGIADYLEDQPINPQDELLAALLGGLSGPVLQGLGRGGAGVKGIGQRAVESVQGYRAAPGVARGFQAVEEARQLGRGAMGAGQQLAGNVAAQGVPGLAETAIGERGRQLTPELIRLLSTRKGPKPTPQELDALLKLVGR